MKLQFEFIEHCASLKPAPPAADSAAPPGSDDAEMEDVDEEGARRAAAVAAAGTGGGHGGTAAGTTWGRASSGTVCCRRRGVVGEAKAKAKAAKKPRGKASWGRAMRRAVSRWYLDRSPMDLAYQITKYRNRKGERAGTATARNAESSVYISCY